MKVLGEMGNIEKTEDSWKKLYANHGRKEVYLGRSVVGEVKGEGENKKFTINEALIDAEAQRMGLSITGAEVNAEFTMRMSR